MEFIEIKKDLFTVDDSYYLAHCISSDCALGAGIAVEFEKRFKLRDKLLKYSDDIRKYPTCIRVGKVFNLITKEKYWHKPTIYSLESTLWDMREIIELNDIDNISKIAIPKIGSGLDRLNWNEVRKVINKVFQDINIEILVCYK